MDSTLTKLGYPKIDRLCDASFIRSIFKSTKKDFAFFVSENQDLQDFLDSLEQKIEQTNTEYQGMIQEYVESIPDEVNQFKVKLKEIGREKKKQEKALAKQMLREEILREMEAEKKKKELEEKLGITKPDPPTTPEKTTTPQPDPPKTKGKTKFSFRKRSPPDTPVKEVVDQVLQQTMPPKTTIQDSMDLGLFFEFLKEVVKNGHLVIKNDSGRLDIRDLDLDEDKIRIKVE
jgi:hypothetical protein